MKTFHEFCRQVNEANNPLGHSEFVPLSRELNDIANKLGKVIQHYENMPNYSPTTKNIWFRLQRIQSELSEIAKENDLGVLDSLGMRH